ncbi:hypothetical protein CEXT_86151 [Caerostris extrusa]|uniref:Uncharacterized protein n=1 Tax=Caerostris extrusa TaxID=172846 RepID=A0AAV4WT67_CAEEX|nr:hypothetical protein CEXT_86151 [Caerostris extrusa]
MAPAGTKGIVKFFSFEDSGRNVIGKTSYTKSQSPLINLKRTNKTKLDTQLPKLKDHSILLLLSRILNAQHRLSPKNPTPATKSHLHQLKMSPARRHQKKLGWMSSKIKSHSRFRYLQTEKTARTPARDRWREISDRPNNIAPDPNHPTERRPPFSPSSFKLPMEKRGWGVGR